MKNILLLMLISLSCFGQLDITKRKVAVDSLKARNDSIYIKSPASYNGYEVATVKDAAASGIGSSSDGEILYNNAGVVDGSPITTDGSNITQSSGTTSLNGILFTGGTKTAGAFYTGTEVPTNINRLNYDGSLYATAFRTGIGNYSGRSVEIINSNASGTGGYFSGNSGIYAFAANAVGTNGYGVYTAAYNTNSTALYALSPSNKPAVIERSGTTGSASPTDHILSVNRISSGSTGTPTISGNIINIIDNPTGTYTSISGKVFSATIGSTERISLNPRATSTTFGYIFDTHISLDSVLSIRNNGNRSLTISNIETKIFNNTSISGNLTVDGDLINTPPHAAFFRNTDTTISATQNVWYKFRLTTTKDIDGFIKQRDTIQFTKAGSYAIDFTISFSGLNNEVWEVAVFKNGTMEEPSQLRYTSTADVGNMSCPVYVTSDGNDWFSFKIRNTTDSDDPTLKRVSIIITTQHLD